MKALLLSLGVALVATAALAATAPAAPARQTAMNEKKKIAEIAQSVVTAAGLLM